MSPAFDGRPRAWVIAALLIAIVIVATRVGVGS